MPAAPVAVAPRLARPAVHERSDDLGAEQRADAGEHRPQAAAPVVAQVHRPGARAGGIHGNKGEEAALAALEMASLIARIQGNA